MDKIDFQNSQTKQIFMVFENRIDKTGFDWFKSVFLFFGFYFHP